MASQFDRILVSATKRARKPVCTGGTSEIAHAKQFCRCTAESHSSWGLLRPKVVAHEWNRSLWCVAKTESSCRHSRNSHVIYHRSSKSWSPFPSWISRIDCIWWLFLEVHLGHDRNQRRTGPDVKNSCETSADPKSKHASWWILPGP